MPLYQFKSETPDKLYTGRDDDDVMVRFVSLLNKLLGEKRFYVRCLNELHHGQMLGFRVL